MQNTQQRLEFLAAQFDGFVRDLRQCQTPKRRWVLLEGMTIVIEEIDRLLFAEQLAAWESPGTEPT